MLYACVCLCFLIVFHPSEKVTVDPELSAALGNGLKCGFLGLLHMEVFHQRLTDEFNLPVLLTTPQVSSFELDTTKLVQGISLHACTKSLYFMLH